MNPVQPPVLKTGIVKLVQSGDSLIIRKQPKGGPPPEKLLSLSGITAPKLARQRSPNNDAETKDEPYAWEAREFLRTRLIGKEVVFTSDKPPNSTNREFGCVWAGKDHTKDENVAESLVAEGLAKIREGARNAPQLKRLVELEEAAKAHGKGVWGTDLQEHIRDVKFTVDNPKAFVNKYNGKNIKAVIEYVRDGSTVRALLLPDFYQITLMLAGIRCPTIKNEGDAEPFAEEARFFVECTLLQRDCEIVLQSVNNNNFVGTIIHPNGNIAEALLKQGFARCVDWSLAVMKSGQATSLRAAERTAKDARLRIWRSYTNTGPQISPKDKEYQATVIEVYNGDALLVKLPNNTVRKIFLASIRPPREKTDEEGKASPRPKSFKPLYDIPWMFEAREFLRKKLIGKKVTVTVDYIQPAKDTFPEKTCCSVNIGGANVAEALVLKGLATVVRYRKDDDQRSSHYDKLLEAEAKALKSGVGVNNKKNVPSHRIQDTSGDAAKAKKFLHFLKRAQKTEATVEFVISGSRMRVYIPKESVIITFLLAGIKCPRGARPAVGGASAQLAEPYGEEALNFTKEKILQRDVTVTVEDMDKAGNFFGWLWLDSENLSVSLVEQGLASVHFTAESSEFARSLKNAEEAAKANKLGIWKDFVEVEPVERPIEVAQDRRVKYEQVLVTYVTNDGHFYAQSVENGPKLEALMEGINREFSASPPLPGAHHFKRGDVCAARFLFDNNWYRAKVERVQENNVSVVYIDYGNRETLDVTRCAALPGSLASEPAYATEYVLACIKFPTDDDDKVLAVRSFSEDIKSHKVLHLNVEVRGSPTAVSLVVPGTGEDIGKALLSDGLVLVDNPRDWRLAPLIAEYRAAQESAKKQRLNLWQHGDITEDDAREFGIQH